MLQNARKSGAKSPLPLVSLCYLRANMVLKRDFLVRVSAPSAAGVFGVGIIIILIALFVTKTFKPAQDSLANHIPAEDTVFFLRTRQKRSCTTSAPQ